MVPRAAEARYGELIAVFACQLPFVFGARRLQAQARPEGQGLRRRGGRGAALVHVPATVRSGQILIEAYRLAKAHDRGQKPADPAVAYATPGLTLSDDPVGY
jgi:hypothetical protein